MNKQPFFIIGCQRSGTTLVRLILNSHSQIAIPEEGTFWMPLLRRFRNRSNVHIPQKELENILKYISKNSQFKLWCMDPNPVISEILSSKQCTLRNLMEAFYKHYAILQGKNIWGDKTPSFFRMIPVLNQIFPEAKFIHVVRDGRDVYLSRKRMNPLMKNLSVSAIEWKYKIIKARRDLEKLPTNKWIEIRYEDLVKNPENIVKKICEFLGIKYEKKMLLFYKDSSKYIGKHHSKLIFKPISKSSLGRYKRELSFKDTRKFELLTKDLLKLYKYEILTSRSYKDLLVFFEIFLDLLIGIPVRIVRVLYIKLILDISSKLGVSTTAAGAGENSYLKN